MKVFWPTGAEKLVLEGPEPRTSDCDPLQPPHRASMQKKKGTAAGHSVSPEKGACPASALLVLTFFTSQVGVTCK